MRDFKKLNVWMKAHQHSLAVYRETRGFPSHELYGLTSQIRRAAVSIATNIAEGCGRDSDAELVRFLRISMGSGNEVEHLLLSRDLGYLEEYPYKSLCARVIEVKRMLAGLITRLQPSNLGA